MGCQAGAISETKIIDHMDGQETWYLVKLSLPVKCVTLVDWKGIWQQPSWIFFKSIDHGFGVVKEETWNDSA